MHLQLLVTRGPNMGTAFQLEQQGTYIVGREDDCSIRLDDPRVSRHHCQISLEGGRATLQDLNSSWGTHVNGQPITTHALQPGDVVRLSETEMRFEVPTSAAAATWQPGQSMPQDNAPAAASAPPPQAPPAPAPISQTPPQPQPAPPNPAPAPPPEPALGQRLAHLVGGTVHRYEVLEVLAEARTGVVFRANDPKKDRQVALKVLWPELSESEQDTQRFVRAVKTVMGVKHPNLVELHGAGKSHNHCWVAVELVEGDSLAARVKADGVTWQQSLGIAMHIASALEAAADKGFVHRNITPTHILIRSRDGMAKLGDLMLAKAMEGSEAAQVTRAGETVGDIPYLAPEQLSSSSTVDIRADIYSLGASLYAGLTGQPPCGSGSLGSMLIAIQSKPPQDPREFNASIPENFAALLMKTLEKSPDDRFQTPTELLEALEHVSIAGSGRQADASASGKPAKQRRRRKKAAQGQPPQSESPRRRPQKGQPQQVDLSARVTAEDDSSAEEADRTGSSSKLKSALGAAFRKFRSPPQNDSKN